MRHTTLRGWAWAAWAIVGLALGVATAKASAPAMPKEVIDSIHARVTNGYTPGIVVGLLNPNGTTWFSAGVGELDAGAPVNEDSLFEIGSITKTFTATLLSQQILAGDLALTDLAESLLPPGITVPTRNGKAITLRHLATHTSGLPRMPTNWQPADMLDPYVDYTVQNMEQFLGTYTLPRDPGAGFEYSNFGMGLLGYLLTLRTGQDYETLVLSRITGELGMSSTAITLSPALAQRLAPGHSGVVPVPNWNFGPPFIGAGALRSSARDLLQYVAANMGLTPSALYPAMTNAHRVLAPAFTGISIGLAWFTSPSTTGDQLIWHDGATGGYRAFAGFRKAGKFGVVVLANSDYSIDDLGLRLLDPGQALATVRRPVALDPAALRALVGRFEGPAGDYFDVNLRHSHLTVAYSADRGIAFTLYASGPLAFFPTIVDATARYQTNAQGAVTSLVWMQSGQTLTYPKAVLPARLAISRAGGHPQLTLTGDTGVNYVLEAGSVLGTWTPVSTNTIWDSPLTPPAPSQPEARFYRLRRP